MSADILDDLFHNCALAAFVEQAVACQSWPDMQATRDLAYRLFEQALAEKHASTNQPSTNRTRNRPRRELLQGRSWTIIQQAEEICAEENGEKKHACNSNHGN